MSTPTMGRLAEPVDIHDHVRGPLSAPVTLVEYGDYQCPFCGRAYPIIHELLDQRPSTVRFVFRNFPVTNLHPLAEYAAEAAEAAAARNRFWEMHDWLYEHQDQVSPPALRLAAATFGLPADEVAREIDEHRYMSRIRDDFVGGVRSGVNGTPTFFVNGVRHDRGYALPDLLMAVDAAAGSVG
jgi:protein-disulfide isomerase